MSDFKGAFSFHIPAEEFEQTLREGPIWKLGSVDVNAGDHDRPEDVLLKTKLLTHPGHTKNPELKVWASSHPQMKEVQCIHNHNMPRRDLYATEKTCIHCCNYVFVVLFLCFRMVPVACSSGGGGQKCTKNKTAPLFREA